MNLEKLKEEFPEFYSKIHFECGSGWYDLLRDLSLKIREHTKEYPDHGHEDEDYGFSPIQVKEKYGTLRYYTCGVCFTIAQFIDEAEKNSAKICEKCGKPGDTYEVNGGKWMYTRCEECFMKMKD